MNGLALRKSIRQHLDDIDLLLDDWKKGEQDKPKRRARAERSPEPEPEPDVDDEEAEIKAIKLLLAKIKRMRDPEVDEIEIRCDMIAGPEDDGAWPSKTGGTFYFKANRPSGALFFLPANASEFSPRGIKANVVGSIAEKKLLNEIDWIRAGKPRRWNWRVPG